MVCLFRSPINTSAACHVKSADHFIKLSRNGLRRRWIGEDKAACGKRFRLTFQQPSSLLDPLFCSRQRANGVSESGTAIRLKSRYLFQSLKQYRDASLARWVGEQVAG